MNNYIKPPALSTSFSESGKSAKKRFDNILKIKTKKTGIIAFTFILVLIGIVGTMVACDTTPNEENVSINDTKNLTIVIRDLINTICSSPLESSDPKDYIEEHQKEFNELIDMDINALSYMFKEFEKNDGTDILRENIMMLACRQILDAEDIKYTAARGVHWYDTMKDYIINQVYLNGYDFVKAHNPKAYIILDINGSLVTESQPNANYAQVMKYLGKDLIETYSPHYIIVDQFPASYEEKISNDDFEATFFYKMIFKNYYKDPDTVGYIKEAKEKDSKSYQTLYDEYNMEKECNYDLRVTTKILPDKSLDMDTFKLYHNMSPKGIEWQEIEGFSEFIIGN